MFISKKEFQKHLSLIENTLKCLLKNGEVTITEIREKTIYQFSSREVSWALKRLRKIGLVTYKGRVWYLNETFLKGMGLLAFQEILNYVLKKQ